MDPLATCPCGRSLPRNHRSHRKYCASCSKRASVLWKRRQRAANRGMTYWLDHWLKAAGSEEEGRRLYNEYMRQYMRKYRLRTRRPPTSDNELSLPRAAA
jgi:hypothetical protein